MTTCWGSQSVSGLRVIFKRITSLTIVSFSFMFLVVGRRHTKKRHQSNQRAFHLHNSMASSGCNWIAADPQGGNLTLGAHVLLLPAPAIVGTSAPVIGSISTRSRDTQRAKQGQWIEQAECRSGKPNPAALLATRDASQKGSDLSLLLGSPAVRLNRISRAS